MERFPECYAIHDRGIKESKYLRHIHGGESAELWMGALDGYRGFGGRELFRRKHESHHQPRKSRRSSRYVQRDHQVRTSRCRSDGYWHYHSTLAVGLGRDERLVD